jgi:hypothetical protein
MVIGFSSINYTLLIIEFSLNQNRSPVITSVRGIFLDLEDWIPEDLIY